VSSARTCTKKSTGTGSAGAAQDSSTWTLSPVPDTEAMGGPVGTAGANVGVAAEDDVVSGSYSRSEATLRSAADSPRAAAAAYQLAAISILRGTPSPAS
jgi:hypothetical protein